MGRRERSHLRLGLKPQRKDRTDVYFSKIIAAIVIAAVLCVILVTAAALLIYQYLIRDKLHDADRQHHTKERRERRPSSG